MWVNMKNLSQNKDKIKKTKVKWRKTNEHTTLST